jgi:hypothetical protein
MSLEKALGVSSLISGLCFRFLLFLRVAVSSVVKMPFSFDDRETERGFATVVGGRSILQKARRLVKGRHDSAHDIATEPEGASLLRLVYVTLPGMFVRHVDY